MKQSGISFTGDYLKLSDEFIILESWYDDYSIVSIEKLTGFDLSLRISGTWTEVAYAIKMLSFVYWKNGTGGINAINGEQRLNFRRVFVFLLSRIP